MHLSESELDNILIGQKDFLYDLFREAVGCPEMREEVVKNGMPIIQNILTCLEFNLFLWNQASYGYKGKEIVQRIEVALRNTRDDLHHSAHVQHKLLTTAIYKCTSLYGRFKNIRDVEERPLVTTAADKTAIEQICGMGSLATGPLTPERTTFGPSDEDIAAQCDGHGGEDVYSGD